MSRLAREANPFLGVKSCTAERKTWAFEPSTRSNPATLCNAIARPSTGRALTGKCPNGTSVSGSREGGNAGVSHVRKESTRMGLPSPQGLYDPRNEHDACGVGFVANIKGRKSHDIIRQGLEILVNLDHRGAVGADPLVGDGAGCLIQIPDALIRDWAVREGEELPAPGDYAVAMCFLPQDPLTREVATSQFEKFIRVEGQELIGWRDVPTNTTGLGKTVLEEMPVIRQAIIARGPGAKDQDAF